jgi:hypothetical protein
MSEPLPNCPCCDGRALPTFYPNRHAWAVTCVDCEARGPCVPAQGMAIDLWRRLASAVALAAAVEAIEHNDEAFSVRKIVATGSWAATIGTTMAAYPSLAAALRALAGEGAEGA